MRTQEQIADIVEATCEAIELETKGRNHPRQDEIIAKECKKNNISEAHIRNILIINEKQYSSTQK